MQTPPQIVNKFWRPVLDTLRVERVEIHLVRLPLNEPFETSFGRIDSRLGRAHNIALASLPGFTLPGDVSASSRYFARDVIVPGVSVAADGTALTRLRPTDKEYASGPRWYREPKGSGNGTA